MVYLSDNAYFRTIELEAENKNSPRLSDHQRRLVNITADQRKSIFLTGPAGTGKSFLLRTIIDQMKIVYKEENQVAVTAATGMAAYLLNAITLHKYTGIGLGDHSLEDTVTGIRKNRVTKDRWDKMKVLIVDEISMISGRIFTLLDNIAQNIKGNKAPFGGIQVILCGDFYQLPPIDASQRPNAIPDYCFLSKSWSNIIWHSFKLTRVFRQADPVFTDLLYQVRHGRYTDNVVNQLRAAFFHKAPPNIMPTKLFSTRYRTDQCNKFHLERDCVGKSVKFDAIDLYYDEQADKDDILNNLPCPASLELRKHARVMLNKNISPELCNGRQGTVVSLCSPEEAMFTAAIAGIGTQYCLDVLSNKISPQEAVEKIKADLVVYQDEEEPPSDSAAIKESTLSHCEFLLSRLTNPSDVVVPVVRFDQPGTPLFYPVSQETWHIEGPKEKMLATRQQLPLILAWALSIHKSQGQTLEWVEIDATCIFAPGQFYVALSRGTDFGKIKFQHINFDKLRKLKPFDCVVDFYENMKTPDDVKLFYN